MLNLLFNRWKNPGDESGFEIAQNPQAGMSWNTKSVLGIDGFKIAAVHSPQKVDVIEFGYPRGYRLQTVDWPDYLHNLKNQLTNGNSIKYLGIHPVTEQDISHAKMWSDMWDSRCTRDF
ncbi:MAG: hypothetical protein ACK4VI_00525 [Alphaproteobacteria bacterium]